MAHNLIVRIINRIRIKANIYCKDLTDERIDPKIFFSNITEDEIEVLRNRYPSELSQKKVDILISRLKSDNNKKVFKAVLDSEIVGYCCLSFEDTIDNGVQQYVKVSRDEAYLFDDYVFIKFRGNGIHKASILFRNNYAREKCKVRSYVCIYSTNKQSIRNYSNIGFAYKYSLVRWFPVWK